MTVGELKAALAGVDDDVVVVLTDYYPVQRVRVVKAERLARKRRSAVFFKYDGEEFRRFGVSGEAVKDLLDGGW